MSFCDTYYSAKKVRRFLSMEESDRCDEVKENPSLAYAVFVEHSDMGIHAAQVVCKDCHEQAQEEEKSRTKWCYDCKTSKLGCEMWREWDFNPSEGGEDLFFCPECRQKPKHLARLARDRREYEAYLKEESEY